MLSHQSLVRQVCRGLGSRRSCYDYQPHPYDEASLKAAIERLAGEWPTRWRSADHGPLATRRLPSEPYACAAPHARDRAARPTSGAPPPDDV